ncbi:MAG TPA: hypothetical protein VJ767_10885 [Nitrososphaeraceae archaeon]|nr:hypothetical protein [Nitrososphaeraceae archaeon]
MNNNNIPKDKFVSPRNYTYNKNICYATNCNNPATLNIVLIAGQKQIPVRVCSDCKSKFE